MKWDSLNSLHTDLQIYAVTPIPENQEVLQRDGIPDNIKSFYKVNHIWRFRYDRPFHKGTKDKENEFKVKYHAPSQATGPMDWFVTSTIVVLFNRVWYNKFTREDGSSDLTVSLLILIKIIWKIYGRCEGLVVYGNRREKSTHLFLQIKKFCDILKAELEAAEQPPEKFVRQMGKHC